MWIVLVGFNASGKTSLARRLALLTDRRALDLDRAVEERAGRTLAEIFAADGPERFRDLEAAVLSELPAKPTLVIATGGGTVERSATVDMLRERGLVVWLDASWPVLRERLAPGPGEDPSPVWNHLGQDVLAALYARRRPLYAASAQIRLDSGRQDPAALVRRLLGRSLQLRAADRQVSP